MSGRDNPIPISDTDVPAAHKKSMVDAADESTTTTSAQRPASPSTKLVDDVADRNGGCSTTNGQLRNSIEMEQHQHQQLTDNGDEVKRDDQTDFFMVGICAELKSKSREAPARSPKSALPQPNAV